MSRNNQQNRKAKSGERIARMKRIKTAARQERAQRNRDPRFVALKNAAVDAAHEYLAEGKTPEETRKLIADELKSMAKSVGK